MSDQTASPIVELDHIRKQYGSAATDQVVLDDVSLRVEAGQSLAIIGVSGSGKTTLLNILGLLDRPTSGTLRLGGQDVASLDESALAALRNRKIGFVFQMHHLLPQLTVLENVLLPVLAQRKSADEPAVARARALLRRVGLEAHANQRPGQLSGGQQQRAAVVRALINQPEILLADEPTGALDHGSSQSLADLLVELNATDALTLIVVTHNLELAGRMRQVYELGDGKLSRHAAGGARA
jgi:lipoprotein-releasing system ATP-binding protein